MMKCSEINERLGEYWDLSGEDEFRRAVDRHVAHCASCKEQFELWRESANLIQTIRQDEWPEVKSRSIASDVMNRIYADEKWRMPIAFKNYSFTYKVRRNIMACIAMCSTIFVVSFLISLVAGSEQPRSVNIAGILETAHAKSGGTASHQAMFDHLPVASISAPSMIQVGPIHTYTDYLLVTSLIGFIITLLLMNWLSRIRA